MMHLKSYKRLKVDHTDKWYMPKPESLLENEIYIIFWDFEIKIDHLISTRKPYIVLINKKRTCKLLDFAVQVNNRGKNKKESEKIDKYLDLAREL